MDLSKLSTKDLLALRDNKYEGISSDGLNFLLQASAPQLSPEEREKRQGFGAAFGQGFEQFKTSGMRGLGEMFGSESMVQAARQRQIKEQADPSFIPTEEADVAGAFERGVLPGVGALAQQYLTEPVGGMAGRIVAPAVAGVGAAVAAKPLALGALGAAVLTGGAIGLSEFPTLFGETIERMEAEGKPLDRERAAKFAAGQAVLSGLVFPGVGALPKGLQTVFKSKSDKIVQDVLEGKLTKEVGRKQLDSTLRTMIRETAITGAAATTVGTGIEMLQRAAAEQELFDDDAFDAYLEMGKAGLLFGPLIGVPVGGMRARGARKQVEQAGAQREGIEATQRRAEEDAAAQQAELQERGMLFSPEELGGERVGPPELRDTAEIPQAPAFNRFELQQKEQTLTQRLDDLRAQIEQAAQGRDFEAVQALTPQAKTLQDELKATSAQLKEAGGAIPSVEALEKRLDSQTKALQKAASEGDTDKVASLIGRVRETEQQLAQVREASMPSDDLFARADRAEAEGRARVDDELAKQTEDFQQLVARAREASDDTLIRLQEEMDAMPEIIQKTSDENLVARMEEVLEKATQNNASKYARTADDRSQREILQAQQKIDRVKARMQEVVESGDLRPIPALRNRLAQLIEETAVSRPEVLRNKALDDQVSSVETLRSAVEDLRAGRVLGEGTRDPATAASTAQGITRQGQDAIAAYTDASIREVNALRRANKQQPLTNTEAVRLAMDVRGRLENVLENRNINAVRVGKGDKSPVERQLAQIKQKYYKGEPTRQREQGFRLRQEQDPIEALRRENARDVPDPERVRLLERQIKTLRRQDAEAEAARTSQAEASARAERVEQSGIPGEGRQMQLFGEKDLAPIATVRATPDNFMRLLRSDKVQRVKADIDQAGKKLDSLEQQLSTRSPKQDADFVADLNRQRQFVNEVKNADKLAANLRNNAKQLWSLRSRAQKRLDQAQKELTQAQGALRKDSGNKAAQDAVASAKSQVDQFSTALKNIDDSATARMREIDALHKKANDLLSADLKLEQSILAGMERRYARTQKASPAARKLEADMRRARAQIGQTEAAIRNQKEAQARAARESEQARLEAQEARPRTVRTIEETPFKVPGAEERVLQKKTKKVEPKSKAEIAEAQKAKQQDVAEQLEARRKAAKKMTLAKALKQESQLNKDLEAVRGRIKTEQGRLEALKTDAARKNAKAKIEKLLADESAIKAQLDEIKPVGRAVERVLVAAGDAPPRTERQKPLRVGKLETAEQRDRELKNYLSQKGLNWKTVDDYYGPDGTAFRLLTPETKTIDPTLAATLSKEFDAAVPSDIKFKSVGDFSELPQSVKDKLARNSGIIEGTDTSLAVRGFVTPEGEVFIIRNNHKDRIDLEATYVHELVGHVSADRLLGAEGIARLSKRVEALPEGAYGLAKDLGITENFKGAMTDLALSIKKMSDDGRPKADIDRAMKEMETQAVRELLAYTAEKRVTEGLRQKLGRWYKELIGTFRDWMRRSGMADLAKVTDADIYNIVRKAMRNYNNNAVGAFRNINGEVSFRKVEPVPNADIDPSISGAVSKLVTKEKGVMDRIKASASGMQFLHRFVDRFAGVEYIARHGFKESLEGVQMQYFNRIADQRSNMVANVASNGPVRLVKNEKDNTFEYKSAGKPSLKSVFEELNKAKAALGNERFTVDTFGAYLALERAAADADGLAAGMRKLDLSGKISAVEADRLLKLGRGNENFQKARKMYREYNDGLIDLLTDTGRITDKEAALYKRGDYVPYYRERNGEIWDVEHNIRIGDVKNQPYLRQLVGGDSAIVNFEVGALQNTSMLTEMALSNISTKNTGYTLQTLGIAEVKKGDGPAAPNVIRFYDKGEKAHAVLNTKGNYLKYEEQLGEMRRKGEANTDRYKKLSTLADKARQSEMLFGDIPAELIVRGMEGISMELPAAISMLRGPANLLRKAVTRNPAYAARIAMKDSLYGWIATGADITPIVDTVKNVGKAWTGDSPAIKKLQEQGIVGGHVFNNTVDDMRTIALQIVKGRKGWEKLAAQADRLAIVADESMRLSLYDGFIKKGMTEMEATLATLEAQNFTKHGFSPTTRYLSTMIPFFNAQIQGLNVFARALTGKQLFEDKIGVQRAAFQRGAMLAGGTMLYAAMMQDNEAYKNAAPEQRLNYWFVPVPFFDEPLRVPIPFEAGLVFKAIPEAIANLATTDEKSSEVLPALAKLSWGAVPGSSNLFLPQGVKPIVESLTNTSFFGFTPIEGLRAQQEMAGLRAGPRTTEVSKLLGKTLGVSPLKIDHFVNAYMAEAGIALLSAMNPLLRDTDAATLKPSEYAIVGSFFQPTDGSGIINKVYQQMQTIDQIGTSFKRMSESDPEGAMKFLNKYGNEIERMPIAGAFRREMGLLNADERAIRADKQLSSEEKRKFLDQIKKSKIELATLYREAIRE